MKKLISYLFLFLFLFNVFFYYPVFLLLQTGIKRSIENVPFTQKESKEFVVFTVANDVDNDLEWMDKNEFRHQGIMYDVIKREMSGKQITYYCRADHKEMKLFAGLESFIKGISDTQNTEKNSSKSPIKEFFKDYYPEIKDLHLILTNSDFLYRLIHNNYFSIVSEKFSPPPKIG